MISNFTEDYLKDYEEQIRKLPLDELYEVLDIIEKDDSPERQNIVKTRIAEIEGEEDEIDETNTKHNFAQFETFPKQPIESNPDLNDFQITTQDPEQAPPKSEDPSNHEITQEEIDNYNNTQPMPDSDGCVSFILCMATGFGIVLFTLVGFSMGANRSAGFHDLKLITILPYLKYIPIGAILFFSFLTKDNKIRDYWINHLKFALGVASFLAVDAATTFISGTYNGISHSCSGTPAYMLATGILFFSIIFIANAFYPISKKLRPRHGLTLVALALILETALR
jgi:hypothetical protein